MDVSLAQAKSFENPRIMVWRIMERGG